MGATCAGPVRRGWAERHHLLPLRLYSSPLWLYSSPLWLICSYCALSRVSFGLNTGGAGAGPGDNLRAPPAPGRSGAAGLDATIPGLCCLSPRPRGSTLAPVARLSAPVAHLSPPWLNTASPRPVAQHFAPVAQLSLTWPASADSH